MTRFFCVKSLAIIIFISFAHLESKETMELLDHISLERIDFSRIQQDLDNFKNLVDGVKNRRIEIIFFGGIILMFIAALVIRSFLFEDEKSPAPMLPYKPSDGEVEQINPFGNTELFVAHEYLKRQDVYLRYQAENFRRMQEERSFSWRVKDGIRNGVIVAIVSFVCGIILHYFGLISGSSWEFAKFFWGEDLDDFYRNGVTEINRSVVKLDSSLVNLFNVAYNLVKGWTKPVLENLMGCFSSDFRTHHFVFVRTIEKLVAIIMTSLTGLEEEKEDAKKEIGLAVMELATEVDSFSSCMEELINKKDEFDEAMFRHTVSAFLNKISGDLSRISLSIGKNLYGEGFEFEK
jgi:hypothetical protein